MKKTNPPHPITINEIGDLSIDDAGRLYWKGEPVVTEKKILVSRWINIAIIVTAIATLTQAACAVLTLWIQK